ncbi:MULTISPECIES: response regulator transcription factor [unclassified Adlercreutzia]|uniref:response regulator transcription factor n=1 Tax=unclassified Adlercreutzia TaxID=2636013 RepID=UPI0013EC03A0|nr:MULTISPECIES: response regulator transcription factor [unclassified Adlercreutzia]
MNDGDRHLLGKHVMLVDDEPGLLAMVAAILRQEGFSRVSPFTNPFDALAMCQEASERDLPHLLVLDVMMPGMDGLALLSQVRALPPLAHVPAVFLTAKDEPADRVSGLGLGADDYIAKPFLPQELVLRIMAVLRRCYAAEATRVDLQACSVDLSTAEVTRADGLVMSLTAKEHDILGVLARNRGRIVTIDAICEACWGDTFGYENTLMAHIRRLREKIEVDPSHPASLVTVKGLGYKLTTLR